MKWSKTAPSNIALIKYMGKTDPALNLPTNPSLSYTLPNLISTITLTQTSQSEDAWQTFDSDSPINLPLKSQKRFLNHLQYIKNHFNFDGSFIVQSKNNFPHGCGIASSASSFAALTACAVEAITTISNRTVPPVQLQAMLSRVGSGSSCRSFFSPWALWQDNHANEVKIPYENLRHQVIIISDKPKEISSSEAHLLVTTSPAFEGRVERAGKRLDNLLGYFQSQNWQAAFEVVWQEFEDMHHLFKTAETPFDYMNQDCLDTLKLIQSFWQQNGSGPLVTLDAGPNIHLLYKEEEIELKKKFEMDYLKGKFNVL